MISSLILSLVMSSTPMQANDINAIKIQEVARRPVTTRISFKNLIKNEVARKPHTTSISFQKSVHK